jgi:cbb3-type cytochrome oxidase maturation protein
MILLPIALIFFSLAIFLFWWSVGNKQFEDLDREGQRILFDDKQKVGGDDHETNRDSQSGA